jgi:hypothetical protein
MFRKILSDGNIKHFKYAPPTTGLDDISDDRLPEPPYAGVPTEQRSVYYYWWAFLRENKAYRACCDNRGKGPMADLHRDFGDVRGDDFFPWWIRYGRALFCEQEGLVLKIHDAVPADHDFENQLLVSIPLASNTRRALEELEHAMRRLLDRQSTKKSTSGKTLSTARYPVHTNPVIKSLHETLRIWQLSERYQQEGKTVPHHQLADELRLSISREHPQNDPDSRGLKASVVSRALKEARNMITNVGEGRFPDKIGPSPELVAQRLKQREDEARRNDKSLGQPTARSIGSRGRYK